MPQIQESKLKQNNPEQVLHAQNMSSVASMKEVLRKKRKEKLPLGELRESFREEQRGTKI